MRILESPAWIHEICYAETEPPRRPHGGLVPPIDLVRACFTKPFGEGSSHTPCDLTPIAHVLDLIMRRTVLPRGGYHEGLTWIQLWLVHHLISQMPFDIWDLLVLEMEDTLAEGFKGNHQLPYVHWICFLILKACSHIPPQVVYELTSTTTKFPEYNMRQLMGSSTGSRTPMPSCR